MITWISMTHLFGEGLLNKVSTCFNLYVTFCRDEKLGNVSGLLFNTQGHDCKRPKLMKYVTSVQVASLGYSMQTHVKTNVGCHSGGILDAPNKLCQLHPPHLSLRDSWFVCQAAGSHNPTWHSMRGPRLFARHLFPTPSSCWMPAHLQGQVSS